jgi:hypothetical protein
MKTLIAILLVALPLTTRATGITNGTYEIGFRISDMGFQQEVTITNCWWTHNLTAMYFDVVIKKNGSLKRFDGDCQSVRGVVYNGEFKFIIPFANVVDVNAFYFTGKNQDKNGAFQGTGDVPYQGPNGGNNKFTFQMKRIGPLTKPSTPTK